jgi:7-carboxy-7-deazaguanine synthase
MHAVDPDLIHQTAERLDTDEIITRLKDLPNSYFAQWVTLSGGDPVHWDLDDLVSLMPDTLKIAVETQGAFYKPWLRDCELVTCSPKPPSSGMSNRTDYAVLDEYVHKLERLVFKVVIFDEDDLEFAIRIHLRYPNTPFYLSSGTPVHDNERNGFLMTEEVMERYRWLVETLLRIDCRDLWDVTVLPQMHSMIWGNKKGK